MTMEDQSQRFAALPLQRAHLKAVIASLFASLLFLFGGDAFNRYHPGVTTAGAMSRSDSGQVAARGAGETRFLTVSEQSSRPKLRPSGSGDGLLCPDIHTLWMCRHGDLVQRVGTHNASFFVALAYWSRAPPVIQHTA
jgi:hypothetical protein